MRLRLTDAQEGELIGEFDVWHPAPRALELSKGHRPDGGLVDGKGSAQGRDFCEERYWGILGRRRFVNFRFRRGWELGLSLSEKRDNFAVLWARRIVCARQERQESVATLQSRGDQSRAGVVLITPEAGADEVEDRVGPARSEGRRHVIGKSDARNLANEGAIEGNAWETYFVS